MSADPDGVASDSGGTQLSGTRIHWPNATPATTAPVRFLGRLASLTQITFAVLLGAVASFGFEPGFMPRGLVLLILFALPGVVGLIGTTTGRPSLLIAAAATSGVGAFVAFSGVTLIFLVPTVLFAFGAARLAQHPPPGVREGWVRGFVQAGTAAVIVVLLVGAGASALLNTDSGCWSAYQTAFGVRIERMPYSTGEMEIPGGAISTSCSTGLISARGVGLAGILAGSALGLAAITARRRGSASRPSGSIEAPGAAGA